MFVADFRNSNEVLFHFDCETTIMTTQRLRVDKAYNIDLSFPLDWIVGKQIPSFCRIFDSSRIFFLDNLYHDANSY